MGKAEETKETMKLFDDDNELEDDVAKIEINQEFARRYEHNKKREDLQKLQELEKKGLVNFSDDDSEESSEEEEEEMLKTSKKRDLEFIEALLKVKKQDPSLNRPDVRLFHSDSESMSDDENDNKNENSDRKGKKPMYLKDVVSKHLIEEGPDFDGSEDDDDNREANDWNSEGNGKVKTYAEEQEEARREFLKEFEEAANVEDEKEDFLKVKSDTGKEKEEDDSEFGKKLDELFGEDEKLDEGTKFIKKYLLEQLWLGNGKSNNVEDEDEDVWFSEDEDEIEKQEDYERDYNFRFEENAGDRVVGHSRKVECSVRKKENTRKLQRERKEERMEQAEFERNEELKRLKNLKKKEIKGKLEKIREAAGIRDEGACLLDEDDLEEEFDPEEYDRKMKEAFDNKYYETEDVDPQFASDSECEKPDFDEEDRLLGLPNGWDEVKEMRDGFSSARQRVLKSKVNGEDVDESELVETEETNAKEGKRKRKRKPSEVEKAVREQLMEEYYKLDHEDTIGDLKTRFKYKPVKSKRFGLSTEEILMLDDKELNQYVSLKKLAPYREKEWDVPRIKIHQQKQRNKALLKGETSNANNKTRNEKSQMEESNGDTANRSRQSERKHLKKELKPSPSRRKAYDLDKLKEGSSTENEKSQIEESNGDKANLSRQTKRKKRQAELKPSLSRLIAYGKIHPKGKKTKH